ncbi:DUF1501 domain-containing protein [uncultured Paludibaculum sp.]|uniref:DUF1501 domain-containing protein n=1 Tax=uncultured Paludibaculum sp. TaxID=1765020 RepID=UPI002AAC4092|nr:DUF1501 domain-containing protein [uncultured Paludibaculum sp.]
MKNRFGVDWSKSRGTNFWLRPAIDRRVFFRHVGAAVAGSFFLPGRSLETIARGQGSPVRKAKNVIFVMMAGGPSHTDTFDLKEGAWTLPAMEPTTYGDIRWPRGLFPKLAEQMDSIALIRSAKAWALVHEIMQSWVQIGRNPLSGLSKMAPHIGSVVARELGDPNSIMPAFVSLNSGRGPGQGFLQPTTAPFYVSPGGSGLGNTTSPLGAAGFDRRYGLLLELDAETRTEAAMGPAVKEMEQFNLTARSLMYNPAVDAIFKFDAAERARYGDNTLGNACIAARNLLKSGLGARFIQITSGGWDMHVGIYTGRALNPADEKSTGRAFDTAMGTLIADLKRDGLLDETLILCMGEFGRTVGNPNSGSGRDHFMTQSVMLAGARIRGGRVIGKTDDMGNGLVEPGWSLKREIRPEDLEATLYSALGIDWTKVYHDDPLDRGFSLVPTNQPEQYAPVHELWA